MLRGEACMRDGLLVINHPAVSGVKQGFYVNGPITARAFLLTYRPANSTRN